MGNKAIIIYGPPGSGKSTQAELLAKKLNLIHFNTGPYIERLVHGPTSDTDPILKREKAIFDAGELCTPEWVLDIVKKATLRIADAGFGIVFSGSPRTLFEAFGSEENSGLQPSHQALGLIQNLEEIFARENIVIINIVIKNESEYIRRNTLRVVCSICGLPFLADARAEKCSFCAGAPRKRILDNSEIIKTRLKEYRERTLPIQEALKNKNFKIIDIDGEKLPFEVFADILANINR